MQSGSIQGSVLFHRGFNDYVEVHMFSLNTLPLLLGFPFKEELQQTSSLNEQLCAGIWKTNG